MHHSHFQHFITLVICIAGLQVETNIILPLQPTDFKRLPAQIRHPLVFATSARWTWISELFFSRNQISQSFPNGVSGASRVNSTDKFEAGFGPMWVEFGARRQHRRIATKTVGIVASPKSLCTWHRCIHATLIFIVSCVSRLPSRSCYSI